MLDDARVATLMWLGVSVGYAWWVWRLHRLWRHAPPKQPHDQHRRPRATVRRTPRGRTGTEPADVDAAHRRSPRRQRVTTQRSTGPLERPRTHPLEGRR